MILREPFEIAYLHNQEKRQKQEDQMAEWLSEQEQVQHQEQQQMAEAMAKDALILEEVIKRWGSKPVLAEISVIHERLATDGSKVQWSILSRAYLTASYDDPNPGSREEF
jgi:hypothetical protein